MLVLTDSDCILFHAIACKTPPNQKQSNDVLMIKLNFCLRSESFTINKNFPCFYPSAGPTLNNETTFSFGRLDPWICTDVPKLIIENIHRSSRQIQYDDVFRNCSSWLQTRIFVQFVAWIATSRPKNIIFEH